MPKLSPIDSILRESGLLPATRTSNGIKLTKQELFNQILEENELGLTTIAGSLRDLLYNGEEQTRLKVVQELMRVNDLITKDNNTNNAPVVNIMIHGAEDTMVNILLPQGI